MNVLLDTVALYRAAVQPEALPGAARAVVEDSSNTLHVSLVSAWELTIKASLGKLSLPSPIDAFYPQVARDLLARTLELDIAALGKLSGLPLHHSDPFDRLLIAQALVAGCAVVTSDRHFAAYGVEVIW